MKSRRDLLRIAGAAPAIAVLPSPSDAAAPVAADPLVALGAEWSTTVLADEEAHAAFEAAGDHCYDDESLGERASACRDARQALETKILATAAISAEGALVKLLVARQLAEDLRRRHRARGPQLCPEEQYMRSALADLERLVGKGA